MRFLAILILAISFISEFSFAARVGRAGTTSSGSGSGSGDSWEGACRGRGCDDGSYESGNARTTLAGPPMSENPYTSCYNYGIKECIRKDSDSADACKPPTEIVTMIQMIAPLMQGGSPKEACTKLEILYSLAGTMEYVWAQKCYNASDRCVDECGRTLTAMTNVENQCRLVPKPLPLETTGVDYCFIYEPGKASCNCFLPSPNQNTQYDCEDPIFDEQKADVKTRKGACARDRARSLTSMIEAGLMGVTAFFNDKCRQQAQDLPAPTVPPGTTGGPSKCYTVDENGYLSGYKDPACINFCEDPRNQGNAKCDCEAPENAMFARCNCKKKSDKTNPACVGVKVAPPPTGPAAPKPIPPTTPIVTSKPNPSPTPNPNRPNSTLNEDIDGGTDQEYNPAGGAGGPGQKVGDIPGGGGGGIGGFSGGGGGGQAAGGPGEGPYKTDIDKGIGNAGAGGMGGGGGGYPNSGGGGGYGPEGDKDKMDWSKFLPKVDKARGLANDAEMAANGITSANGLSNFEKVTKKMNEKRPALLP
jgi:hypothetical protein